MSSESLYQHQMHAHIPHNVNALHAAEVAMSTWNQRLAVWVTQAVSSMWTAYTFALLATIGLLGILGWLSPVAVVLVSWTSQTFLQLVFLPILSVGQAVVSRKQELQADEQFRFVEKTYHDIEEIGAHLAAQDAVLMQMVQRFDRLEQRMEQHV